MKLAQLLVIAAKRADYKRVQKAADDHLEAARELASRAFARGREAYSKKTMKQALRDKDERRVLTLVSRAIVAVEKSLKESLSDLLLEIMAASATSMEKRLRAASVLRTGAPRIKDFSFDKTNEKAQEWASEHAAETIRGISETTREEIRELVEGAFEEQYDVDELADKIADLIGDEARAETIARTETMRASNEGQQQLWDQAQEAGFLRGDEKKEWITTPDDRLCPICEPMDGVTVGLDEEFDVDGESLDGPPAHPNCRCTIALSV